MSSPIDPTPVPDARPKLVMLCNAQTPYRLALHLRIAREIPAIQLVSAFTHEVSNSPWVIESPPEIGPVFFGHGTSSDTGLRQSRAEWGKGGRVIEYLRSIRPSVVIVHGYNDVGRLRVLHYCQSAGIPAFIWGDSNVKSDQARGIKKLVKSAYIRHVLSKTVGTMVCGSLGKQFFVSYGADPQRIYYVPYEPDYKAIQSLPESRVVAVAERFGLTAGRRRIVYSGRLVGVKRVDLLVRAFVVLAGARRDWDLVIAGDGELKGELQALVPRELEGRVKWLGFLSDQGDVSAVYRNSDVLCLASEHEPWALVVNEAVAAGLAVVASDVVGAAAELVREGVNGKTFVSKDLDGLIGALRWVTDGENIDGCRASSAGVLADWRKRGDPILGLKTALQHMV